MILTKKFDVTSKRMLEIVQFRLICILRFFLTKTFFFLKVSILRTFEPYYI